MVKMDGKVQVTKITLLESSPQRLILWVNDLAFSYRAIPGKVNLDCLWLCELRCGEPCWERMA